MKKSTHERANNSAWKELRKGRITASVCHDVYTKVINIAKKTKPFPKTTPLVAKLVNREEDLSKLPAITWDIENEEKDLKKFYAEESCKHEKVKLQPCGLYIDKTRPFIAASPDNFMHCKCNGQSVVEIKCPHVVRNQTLCDSFSECFFLTKVNEITKSL